MPNSFDQELPPFVFSDPAGKRWPRLRLLLIIGAVLVFFSAILFVQTLFVAPQMNVPFSLRQLKGQLKALQRQNPAGQLSAASLLWQKFSAARQAARKLGIVAPPPPARPRKKPPNNEIRLAFYTNGDPYSYSSLEQHAAQITHLCPEWMAVVNGLGELKIDADPRLPKFAASKGIALMPLLTNLVGDKWQPEAVENLAHGPAERQDRFIKTVLRVLRNAKAAGVVLDWEQIDSAYKKEITAFIDKLADALHDDGRELWLCVQPDQELDYIDFDFLAGNVDRFVALVVRPDVGYRFGRAPGHAFVVRGLAPCSFGRYRHQAVDHHHGQLRLRLDRWRKKSGADQFPGSYEPGERGRDPERRSCRTGL